MGLSHDHFIKSSAAERYLLGEMTGEEQSIFEEHYFDCPVCSADVTNGTRLMVAARAAAQQEASNVVPMKSSRMRWFPQAAAASLIFTLIGGGAGYQIARSQHDRPEQQASNVLSYEEVTLSATRGGTGEVEKVTTNALRFDIPPVHDAVHYVATVQCGEEKQSDNVSAIDAQETVSLAIGELPAGRCELVVESVLRDGNRGETTSVSFEKVGER